MKSISFLAGVLIVAGCSSTPPATTSGEQPVRYVQYVKVATFDTTPRSPTSKLNVLREAPIQKYHAIASLTIDGTADKEGNLVNAIAWKARQIGADSILLLAPLHPHRDQWIFRADAIVMDSEK